MLYSKSTKGFYRCDIHGDNIPADVIEITDKQYVSLLEGQSQGKQIVVDSSGLVALQDPPPPSAENIAETLIRRRRAAYQAEADPLFFKWQAGEATQAEWQAKREEIRQRFPKE